MSPLVINEKVSNIVLKLACCMSQVNNQFYDLIGIDNDMTQFDSCKHDPFFPIFTFPTLKPLLFSPFHLIPRVQFPSPFKVGDVSLGTTLDFIPFYVYIGNILLLEFLQPLCTYFQESRSCTKSPK